MGIKAHKLRSPVQIISKKHKRYLSTMNYKYFIVLFGFLSTFTVHGQDQQAIDSLTRLISEAKHDTTLAAAFIELSNMLYVSNLDTVIPLCIKAKEIAERNLVSNPPPLLKKSISFS